ncbi:MULTISPECIES: hypothetical protein [Legionella]|uniref:Uncharacterized protein n=1 Tax=Legionella resiliens TaxID=2905958 RepID=A0ABS8WZU8_9GAMM|nr:MULTISPECIES: hypothetical protein [unclassified Legionella]MCE0721887.1 hypothetical protein [Legionella sp. 9fVS26]MCE3531041.1 hypothetical protein [Legionella sp. 8cVS16]QLZ70606.1 hypothetical protein FOLKNPGA_03420 [Legionella sp. PC1000]
MFGKEEMKPDYKIVLNSRDEMLLKKYGNRDTYYLDERYKLAILVDIYSGNYKPELKSDDLATEYSKLLVAFCHFDGKWIPEGRYRFNPPLMHTENNILVIGKKFESISNCTTALLHGKEQKAMKLILDGYDFKQGNDRLALLEKYKNTCFAEEKFIVKTCFIPGKNIFDTSKFIMEHQQELNITLS